MLCKICKNPLVTIENLTSIYPPGLYRKPYEGRKIDIEIKACLNCGTLFYTKGKNYETDYWENYNFQRFTTNKATLKLGIEILKYSLREELNGVLSIGEFDNSFLKEIRKHFNPKKVVGIDPAYGSEGIDEYGIEQIKDFFPSKKLSGKFDLIIARNVLEIIPDLENFLMGIRDVLTPNGFVFIEVPNWVEGYRKYPFYFSPDRLMDLSRYSILKLLGNFGFSPIFETVGEYYIGIFKAGNKNIDEKLFLTPEIAKNIIQERKNEFISLMKNTFKYYNRLIIWGAGRSISDLVLTLQELGIEERKIIIVDCDKRKENLYVGGSSIKVIHCEVLKKRNWQEFPIYINSYACKEIYKLAQKWGYKILNRCQI